MVVRDGLAHAQPQSRPLAHFLGREEGFENPAPDALGNAGAVILDGQRDPVAQLTRPDLDESRLPGPVERVATVLQQVDHDLLQLGRLAVDERQAAAQFIGDLDLVAFELPPYQLHRFHDQLVQVDQLALGLLSAGHVQKPSRTALRTLGRSRDQLNALTHGGVEFVQ